MQHSLATTTNTFEAQRSSTQAWRATQFNASLEGNAVQRNTHRHLQAVHHLGLVRHLGGCHRICVDVVLLQVVARELQLAVHLGQTLERLPVLVVHLAHGQLLVALHDDGDAVQPLVSLEIAGQAACTCMTLSD